MRKKVEESRCDKVVVAISDNSNLLFIYIGKSVIKSSQTKLNEGGTKCVKHEKATTCSNNNFVAYFYITKTMTKFNKIILGFYFRKYLLK